MLILSPLNSVLLPQPYADLMTLEDSPVSEFFPEDFKVDPFGGSFEHDYIALLPFIDINKLLKAYYSVDIKTLKEIEQDRNKIKPYQIYRYNHQK